MNEPFKFDEFNVYESRYEGKKFVIEHKKPTKRGSVSISKRDAELMNGNVETTKIFYELSKEQPKDDIKIIALGKMNKAQLEEYVTTKGYDVDMEQTKAEIVKAIEAIEN